MSKFFFILWFIWSLRLTLFSIFSAAVLSCGMSLYIYINQCSQVLSSEVVLALVEVFKFWFVLFWSLTLLVYLFRMLKSIFNKCYNGYKLTLLTCPKEGKREIIEDIGYGDIVTVWRKWLLLIIWLVASFMVIALIMTKLLSEYNSVFEWFNIYILYLFLLLSGYASFIILSSRCKRVRLVKC